LNIDNVATTIHVDVNEGTKNTSTSGSTIVQPNLIEIENDGDVNEDTKYISTSIFNGSSSSPNLNEIEIETSSSLIDLIELKNLILTTELPECFNQNTKILNENDNIETIIQNCMISEYKVGCNGFRRMFSYYRLGYFFNEIKLNIKKKFQNVSDRKITSSIIQESGILNLYNPDKNQRKNQRKNALTFYTRAVRTYEVYQCFPIPIEQIIKTGGKIDPSKFVKVGRKEEFKNFLSDIVQIINVSNIYSKKEADIEKYYSFFDKKCLTDELYGRIYNFLNK